ncbi:MAG: bifunctional UDP-N-acetylglucosamine diphosphorylase/glucosamine-1-phosphate N-acetyltransferase GlmU [Pyrinomonadaceae bacterium]
MVVSSSLLNNRTPAPLDVLILAAGLGTRMQSRTTKVLHQLGGRPLITHVCRVAAALSPRRVYVIVGHGREAVEQAVSQELGLNGATFIIQVKQLGTGDAVMSAREALREADSTLLILSGDVPLVRAETLGSLVHQHRTYGASSGTACTILTVRVDDPTGYGRIVRDPRGRFLKIVEHRDASPDEKRILEVNSGIYCFETPLLFSALSQVEPTNSRGEYYLTDVPAILLANDMEVSLFLHTDPREVSGINTRVDLSEFETLLRQRKNRQLMIESGVTLLDPAHTYVDMDVEIGRDTTIHPNVHLEGTSIIGENCEIRSGARITNSRIGTGVKILDHSVITDSVVADGASIGPFAHLRANTQIDENASVGNFVEIKKSRLGRGSKSMHLTYLGDATIGEKTNIGAGTVTCNYDGRQKHQTIIGDNVKIGSDTMLVAPVTVHEGAVTAAGSVVIEDVPAGTLVAGVPAKVKKKIRSS